MTSKKKASTPKRSTVKQPAPKPRRKTAKKRTAGLPSVLNVIGLLKSDPPPTKSKGWQSKVSKEDLETITELIRAFYRGEIPGYSSVEDIRRKVVEKGLFKGFNETSPGEQAFRKYASNVRQGRV